MNTMPQKKNHKLIYGDLGGSPRRNRHAFRYFFRPRGPDALAVVALNRLRGPSGVTY